MPAVPNQKGSSTSCQPFHALKAACPGCAATAVLIWDTPHAGTRMLSDRSFPRPLFPLAPLLRLTVATQASTDAPRSRARHLKKFASAGAVMRPKRELPGHFEISQAQRALVVLSQAARILRDRSSRRSGLERSSWCAVPRGCLVVCALLAGADGERRSLRMVEQNCEHTPLTQRRAGLRECRRSGGRILAGRRRNCEPRCLGVALGCALDHGRPGGRNLRLAPVPPLTVGLSEKMWKS